MSMLWLLVAIPPIVALVFKFIKRDTPWGAVAIAGFAPIVLIAGIWFAGSFGKTLDREIWNGEVTGKAQVKVSCEHSYPCNCRTECSGSGNNQSCSTVCDTCYEHWNDYDWRVRSNIGDFNISRIDRQGTREPPRWGVVAVGQPVARERTYTNYVQAVPESLFHQRNLDAPHLPAIPAYPDVYDYHYANRVLAVGMNVPEQAQWNNELALLLRKLGPQKQANVIIIVVNTADSSYRHKLEAAWLGGKKNDVVIMLGTTDGGKTLAWVDVMTWALNKGNELFHVRLRDELKGIGTLDRERILAAVGSKVMAHYDRPQMADFAYLRSAIQPHGALQAFLFLLAFAAPIGISLFMRHQQGRYGSYGGYRHRFR